jgi:hypothetical protein
LWIEWSSVKTILTPLRHGTNNMRRVKPDYITVRIEQLKEELTKPNSEHDKNWYNRLIQELSWVKEMQNGPSKNCYMEK